MRYHTPAICCLLALIVSACGGKDRPRSSWSETIPVKVTVIGDGSASAERNYVGDIASEKEITLSFALGGTLTRVAVKNGDHVEKGQVLAEIDATSARSLHATALATLRQAEDAHRRLEAVHREGGLSEVKWVEMETNLEKARQAETSARKRLEDCSLRAPIGGIVSCGTHTVGQDMRPGETFARILDMRRLQVHFSVPEQEITLLKVGDTATATVPAMDNTTLKLRISDKSITANPLGHTYSVVASIVAGDTEGLLPDMVAKVRVGLNATGGIVVPSSCVHTATEGTMVWVVEGGKAQRRPIAVGDFIKNGIVVKSGLSAGDTIVVEGHQKLYTGAKVGVEAK